LPRRIGVADVRADPLEREPLPFRQLACERCERRFRCADELHRERGVAADGRELGRDRQAVRQEQRVAEILGELDRLAQQRA